MLPKTIKVGSHVYRLDLVEQDAMPSPGHWGMVDFATGTITVVAKVPASRQAETILHEVLHAMMLGRSMRKEEELVTTLSEGLLSFLQDNPQFVKHILSKL